MSWDELREWAREDPLRTVITVGVVLLVLYSVFYIVSEWLAKIG